MVVVEKTLESPLDCKEIQPEHLKGSQSWIFIGRTDAEAETPILWPLGVKNWLTGKDPDAGKDWRQEEKGMTEDEIVGWHHWVNGHGFEQATGFGEGQGNLACCSSWGCKESDMTEWLNWTKHRHLIWCYNVYTLILKLSLSFSRSVMSDSLRPHGLQHARLPCPSLSPGLCSNSCPLNQWCHPTISTSVAPFSFCPQSLPASRSFWMSWLFTSGGQSTGASVSASVLPMNSQGWFPLGLTGFDLAVQTPQFKSINSLMLNFLYGKTLTSIHDYWKNHSFD